MAFGNELVSDVGNCISVFLGTSADLCSLKL